MHLRLPPINRRNHWANFYKNDQNHVQLHRVSVEYLKEGGILIFCIDFGVFVRFPSVSL